jgi:hypothetical protein
MCQLTAPGSGVSICVLRELLTVSTNRTLNKQLRHERLNTSSFRKEVLMNCGQRRVADASHMWPNAQQLPHFRRFGSPRHVSNENLIEASSSPIS